MSIHFQCHGCGKDFHVPETMAGTQARCNGCGSIVTIPVPGLTPLDAEATSPQFDPLARTSFNPYQALPAKPARLSNGGPPGTPPMVWVAIAVGGGIVALTLLVVIAGWLFSSSRASPEAPLVHSPDSVKSDGSIDWAPPSPGASAAPTYTSNPPRGYTPAPASAGGAFSPASSGNSANGGKDPVDAPAQTPAKATTSWSNAEPSETPSAPKTTTLVPAAASAPAPVSAEWGAGGGDEVRIPFDDDKVITFGPIGCPVVIAGNDVWNLPTNRLVQTLEGEYPKRVTTALSGDGQWFAAAMLTPNQQDTPVHVWRTATGERVLEVPGDPERFADLIAFTRNKYLVIGGRDSNEVRVWDVETGKQVKSLTFPGSRLDKGKLAFTADGQYFAAVSEKQLVVMKTATGKPAAVMGAPLEMEYAHGVAKEPRRPAPDDAVFVYAWLQDLEFSPDSQELAAISTHPRPRLLCWDNRGKLMLDEPLEQLPSMAFWEHEIQWLPDKSGWIISGNVFDRATKRIVFGVRKGFGEELRIHALDRDRLLGNFPHSPGELQVIQIPWDRIHASLQAMKDGSPAILSPSQPVSVNIQLTELRGDQQETARAIGDALVKRLARDGVRVERNQPSTFQVKFTEKAGDQLPIYERQSPFDFRGHDTGRRATEAKGVLVVELLVQGENAPLWRDTLNASNATSFREEINDATVRKSMLENLASNINGLNIPYFIPKSEDLLALPVVLK